MITSLSNPKIKDACKLREGNYRRSTGRFLVDGLREIERGGISGVSFLGFFVLESHVEIVLNLLEKFALKNESSKSKNLTNRSGNYSPEIITVSNPVLDKISFGNRNEGVIAIAEIPRERHEQFLNRPQDSLRLIAVLEGVEKPGNIGAICRSADGAGLDGIMLVDQLTDLYNPNVIRASLGTIFNMPIIETDSQKAKIWLQERNFNIAVAQCNNAITYTKYDYPKPTAIVLGSEANGLSKKWNAPNYTAISIPMLGIADSLNVSAAAAVIFYEAKRQQTKQTP
ncbi:MAG: hypothetical protein LBQ66_03665 [Planctomycetaceae bacterium]|jgi:TrmH family RNA methyltransferase|nr:hypothetical protein [Planctomycetaceae bacterium]